MSRKSKGANKEPWSLTRAFEYLFEFRYFHPDEALDGQTAIPYVWVPTKSRLVLVLGENAGGKSFFRRMLHAIVDSGRGSGVPGPFPLDEFIHLSMEGRASGGIVSSMIYGNESRRSTGALTVHTVTMGIKTASERNHDVLLYWDEPDIGLSIRAAAGVGITIREWVGALPEHVKAVVITTHSPHLVSELAKLEPQYIHLGSADGPRTIEQWVAQQTGHVVPIMPGELQDAAHARHKLIEGILNDAGDGTK